MDQSTQTIRTNVLPPCTHISLEQLQKNFYDLLQIYIQTCQDSYADREELSVLIKSNQELKRELVQAELVGVQQKEALKRCKRLCQDKQAKIDLQKKEKLQMLIIYRMIGKKMDSLYEETIDKTPHVDYEVFV